MIDKYFPLVSVKITNKDKDWFTPNFKKLTEKRQKTHTSKNFNLRNKLAKRITIEIKKAIKRYNKKKRSNILSLSSKEWYRHINNIIGSKKNSLNLTNIPELANKTPEEQVAIVNAYFANICKKYPPLKKKVKMEIKAK